MSQKLYFNGIQFETGSYAVEPMLEDRFRDYVKPPPMNGQLQPKEVVAWCDMAKLDEAGWGIVFHEKEDPAVLEALEPLIRHRKNQAGERFKQICLREADLSCPPNQWMANFQNRYELGPSGDIDPDKLPYYLLIIGKPTLIPFEFQYELDLNFAVGRLCLENPAGYAAYGQNVIETESTASYRKKEAVFFNAVNDEITYLWTSKVAEPIKQRLKKLQPEWEVECVRGPSATRDRLGQVLGGPATPSLLMTSGHGVLSSSPDPFERMRLQGGLLCSDWGGFGEKIKPEYGFFADDVGVDLNMNGCMAFFFACFTAGTPRFDNFISHDLEPKELHPHAYVASLPQALLGHKRGPLAIIGHVDKAFDYSFLWDKKIHEITHFISLFFEIMEGVRIGEAMGVLNRRFAEISAQVMARKMRQGPDDRDFFRTWMAWYDSRNYIILGDPAVRLQNGVAG